VQLSAAHDGDVGRHLARVIEPLRAHGPFGDILEETVRAFLEHDRHVERTVKALIVHPNTPRHRLVRVEALTATDLSRTADLIDVWWALHRAAIERRADDLKGRD
jgi:putative transposase